MLGTRATAGTQLLCILLGVVFLGSGAKRPSVGPFTFLGEQQSTATSNEISTSSTTSITPEGRTSNHTEPHGTDITTEQMKMTINGTGNATIAEESNEDIIKGRLGPHNTPMGTPSHSKGISFIDDEKEHYKCYACKGKACALTQTTESTMCNTTRRTCWMTYTMTDGQVTRGCSSPDRSIKCTGVYPKGYIIDGKCAFCCTDNLCNWHVLMNSTCVSLNAQSSAPSIYHPFLPFTLLALALSFKLLRSNSFI